jgi:hypothetical protein
MGGALDRSIGWQYREPALPATTGNSHILKIAVGYTHTQNRAISSPNLGSRSMSSLLFPMLSHPWAHALTVLVVGLIPGLLLGWIAFTVAEFSAAHPDVAKRRGCRGGACRRS